MRPMRKFHGHTVGQHATHIYVCSKCGLWQGDARGNYTKPDFFCSDNRCGGTTFIHFSSKAEARGYASLLLRQTAGEIADLELQPRYPLHAPTPDNGRVKLGTYVGDFRFRIVATGEIRVIDTKGDADTHQSAWKRSHCEAEYGIKISIMRS